MYIYWKELELLIRKQKLFKKEALKTYNIKAL